MCSKHIKRDEHSVLYPQQKQVQTSFPTKAVFKHWQGWGRETSSPRLDVHGDKVAWFVSRSNYKKPVRKCDLKAVLLLEMIRLWAWDFYHIIIEI